VRYPARGILKCGWNTQYLGDIVVELPTWSPGTSPSHKSQDGAKGCKVTNHHDEGRTLQTAAKTKKLVLYGPFK
jgi:hypothetical protein